MDFYVSGLKSENSFNDCLRREALLARATRGNSLKLPGSPVQTASLDRILREKFESLLKTKPGETETDQMSDRNCFARNSIDTAYFTSRLQTLTRSRET